MLRAAPYADSQLVLATGKGVPLDARNIINHSFNPLLEKVRLPPIRLHDLRHTCATLLIDGVHPKGVQKLLGHKSVKITLDLYSHRIPDVGDWTADAMDDMF